MDFQLTNEQKKIRQMTADFAVNEISPYCMEWHKAGGIPSDTLCKMQDLGLLSFGVPAQYGGYGLDHISKCLICEEIAKGDAGLATMIVASTLLASGPILVGANNEQKQWWYGRHLEGRFCGFGLNEPEAGSDIMQMSTNCIKDGKYYILNGTKHIVASGGLAQQFSVFATLGKELGYKGICAFMVDRGLPGISVNHKQGKPGVKNPGTIEVVFTDVRVPASMRLGQEGAGMPILKETFDLSRTAVAAMATGVAAAAFEASLNYVYEKQKSGQSLPVLESNPYILADMAVRAEAARLLYLKAAYLQDSGQAYRMHASMANLQACDAAMSNAIYTVQIFSIFGYDKESPVTKYMHEAKIMQIFKGTSQVQRMVIGKYLSKNGYHSFA